MFTSLAERAFNSCSRLDSGLTWLSRAEFKGRASKSRSLSRVSDRSALLDSSLKDRSAGGSTPPSFMTGTPRRPACRLKVVAGLPDHPESSCGSIKAITAQKANAACSRRPDMVNIQSENTGALNPDCLLPVPYLWDLRTLGVAGINRSYDW